MTRRMSAAALSLAGILLSAYLFLYKRGAIGTLACGDGGCETVQLSRYSAFLGVDVALIGILGYGLLLGVSLLGLQPAWQKRRSVATLLAGLSGVGVGFAAYLTYLELNVIHAICRWCVASAVLITLIFVLALLDRRHSVQP
jgi:uncharacterized membrane protein